MAEWEIRPPTPSELGDREVRRVGTHLEGRRIALLVTGGIAAMKAPLLARALRKQGAEVIAFLSAEGARYVTEDTLAWSTTHPVISRLTPEAEHLSDEAPFDAYLVAPATYNTLNKLAAGIADGVVTAALASALGRMEQGRTRVLVVPTMHGSLHNAVLTESLHKLERLGVAIVPPRQDYGKHNLPLEEVIVAHVCREVSTSPLKGTRVLVTGGPTPVAIDSVRRITNRFRGTLGTLIAEELYLRGADTRLLLGGGAHRVVTWLPHEIAETYDDYRRRVHEILGSGEYFAGVFSAAVADYRPKEVLPGKIPSGGALDRIDLEPTPKVIREVQEAFPELHMVTFKYEEGVDHEALMEISRKRLAEGYEAVVANRGEEMGPDHEQAAYLLTDDHEPRRYGGKPAIARGIAEHLEEVLRRRG